MFQISEAFRKLKIITYRNLSPVCFFKWPDDIFYKPKRVAVL
jgi:hypothetical protein